MSPELSRRKTALFSVIAILSPLLLFAVLEVGLRVAHYGGETPLFEATAKLHGLYLVPGRRVAARYFPRVKSPPTPSFDAFLVQKPAHGIRIFVMGESAAAGFPYPANAAFSNVLADALQDVLPTDTVEVVNLGITATNSYTIADLTPEVIAQRPDAVIIYAGHNEYYGALGAGSTETLGAVPAFVRGYLRLQRFKTFLLLRNVVGDAFDAAHGKSPFATPDPHPSRMETVVRDQRITLGGKVYQRGKKQFESNLLAAIDAFRRAGVPVFIGSTPSNLRDQKPFGSVASPRDNSATATFDSACRALARFDTTRARFLFTRARDLDFIRFRAPGEFREIIKRVASKTGAHYVPSEEAFDSAAQYRIPGKDLFLEHVHPNAGGYLLLGRTFFEAMKQSGLLDRADFERLARWDEYGRRMDLTALDLRIVHHTVMTITTRWPFLPLNAQQNYRGTYQPTDFTDSLAFEVSMGTIQWAQAKVATARRFEARGQVDSALAEYAGLMRREPHSEAGYRLAGTALLDAKQPVRARPFLERSYAIEPTPFTAYALGVLARQAGDTQRATALLEQSLSLSPNAPATLYQLSITYAVAHDMEHARAIAARLSMVSPRYPGLGSLASALGMGRQ
ncbi:MAG TPA: GDSL-type esterase/lipase family protein [Gemmatimonadaceae bacterium]